MVLKKHCRPILSLLLLAVGLHAQTTTVAGSGCPSMGFPSQTGSPSVGRTIQTSFTCSSRSEVPWYVVGLPAAPTPLSPNLTCGQLCTQACAPVFAMPGPQWSITIPNDARLIGTCVCVQFACLDVFFGCVTASGALQVCIQP